MTVKFKKETDSDKRKKIKLIAEEIFFKEAYKNTRDNKMMSNSKTCKTINMNKVILSYDTYSYKFSVTVFQNGNVGFSVKYRTYGFEPWVENSYIYFTYRDNLKSEEYEEKLRKGLKILIHYYFNLSYTSDVNDLARTYNIDDYI